MIYSFAAAAMFFFLYFIWCKDDWYNAFLKFGFLVMFIWGVITGIDQAGYIILIPKL